MGIVGLTPSTTPQQSMRGFVAPASVPVKKTPSISDIIGESSKQETENKKKTIVAPTLAVDKKIEVEVNEKTEVEVNEKIEIAVDEKVEVEVNEKIEIAVDEKVEDAVAGPNEDHENSGDFSTHWFPMFQQVFASVPTIYFPLKETLPLIENNIIKVTVKNDVQKEHFEAKTREILEYLRTHYDEKIEDIVVITNEKLETKKIIYDVKDKLQNFKEQNEEFEEFLQILDLKIKD